MKRIVSLTIALFVYGQLLAQAIPSSLEGTWKVEGKETYETWELKDGELIGKSYKIKDGQQLISETLRLFSIGDGIYYEATVPDQNQGRAITFKLNPEISAQLQFENPEHDFPQKIIYRNISDTRILVHVVGDDGKGFSYHMDKQPLKN